MCSMAANMSAKGSSSLSRGSDTPTALESRRRKAITPPAALGTATGGSYSASLSSGNHEAPVDMMKEFRTCMSQLLTQVADLTTEVTALKTRFGDLEREKTNLAATVRFLTDDASNSSTAVQGGPVGFTIDLGRGKCRTGSSTRTIQPLRHHCRGGVTVTPSSAFLSLHTYVRAYHCTHMYAPVTAHLCTRLSLHTYVRAYHCTACARLSFAHLVQLLALTVHG